MALDLHQLILAGMRFQPGLTAAFFEVLDKDAPLWRASLPVSPLAAERAAQEFRRAGSHDLVNLFTTSNSYDEIVLKVGRKLRAEVMPNRSVEENEQRIIEMMFQQAWDRMSSTERELMLQSLNLGSLVSAQAVAGAGLLTTQILLRQLGGFGVYRMAVIVANQIARVVLGRGLLLTANAALTRGVAAVIGPIGWLASGLWLAYDLMGPAWRKILPGVVFLAALRRMLTESYAVGVVGDGSTGKDALIKSVFGIDTLNVNPVAGSTRHAELYRLGAGDARVINFPGFNDVRHDVDTEVRETIALCHAFLVVVDINRGVSDTDRQIVNRVRDLDRPMLTCLNKCDLIRPGAVGPLLHAALTRLRLNDTDMPHALTAFDPDPRLSMSAQGIVDVRCWIQTQLDHDGVNTQDIFFS